MKVTRQDIGGELISIITKGMYSDPRDALREYVQNGVDANAENITLKIRFDRLIISDDGHGMDKVVMRRAIRVGISDKNPGKYVGFMGIGLYSSFHLCDTLTIISKVQGELPNKLVFRFKEMRDYLDDQKESRIIAANTIQQQIDLQTLLEKNIDFITLKEEEFKSIGTRIELGGIESNFYKSLSKFDEISEYLESVVPLPFSKEFSHGIEIQNYIDKVCKKHKTPFRLVNLFIDINSIERQLFRPYKDSDFKVPLSPQYYELKSNEGFLGIAWGCLNSERTTIPNIKVRGFNIKKQGFTIGKRTDLIPYFVRPTFFNRYVGEFIVLHPKLLPNGPRSDFEYSSLRTAFYGEVTSAAKWYNNFANDYQEFTKASSELIEAIDEYNIIASQLEFFENNSDKLLEFWKKLTNRSSSIFRRINDEKYKQDKVKEKEANDLHKKIVALEIEVKNLIDKKKTNKKTIKKTNNSAVKKLIATKDEKISEPLPDSLKDIILGFGFELTADLQAIFDLIDEKFIKPVSTNRDERKTNSGFTSAPTRFPVSVFVHLQCFPVF